MRKILLFGLLVLMMLTTGPARAGTPTVKNITISDVTPFSFCVLWSASEPCTGTLYVYEDIAGTISVAVTLEHQPLMGGNAAIGIAAENLGVMKVRVNGLTPDTTYYVQTVTTSKNAPVDTVMQPAAGALIAVRTEVVVQRTMDTGSAIVPTGNDLLVVQARMPDGSSAPMGALVILKLQNASYPISAFVGDATPQPYQTFLDLNNLFSMEAGVTLMLMGDETATASRFMGTGGISYARYSVPLNSASSMPHSPPPVAQLYYADYDGDMDIDGLDLATFADYYAISDALADANGDGSIGREDVASLADFFGGLH